MLQPKDTDWLNGYQNKTHIYAVYKRHTSDLGIHTDDKSQIRLGNHHHRLNVRGWKKVFIQKVDKQQGIIV